jgi:hypothetical protein
MWVQLNGGAKVTYGDYDDEDPADITEEEWHEWFIDLADFGVTLNSVTTFAIGIGTEGSATPGGAGKVYFDDFRLYTPVCMPSRHTAAMAKLDFAPVGAPDCVVNYEEVDAMADGWLDTDAVETGELLVRWEFNDATGVIASDSSGNGRNGDINDVNGVSWVSDAERGWCLDFQGGDHVIDSDADTYMNGLRGLTVAVWVYNRETTPTDQGFVIFQQPNGTDNRDLRYDADAGGGVTSALKCGVTTDDGTSVLDQEGESQGGEQLMNTWQHVAMTWESGKDIRLFIDGAEITPLHDLEATRSGTTAGYDVLIVGKGGKEEAADQSWNGLIDDVQIYNHPLTPAEIATVMGGGFIPPRSIHYPVSSPGEIYEGEAEGKRVINFKDYAELLKNWLVEVKYPE